MRFRWANSISTFFRSRRDCRYPAFWRCSRATSRAASWTLRAILRIRGARTAARLHRTRRAVGLAGAVDHGVSLGDVGTRHWRMSATRCAGRGPADSGIRRVPRPTGNALLDNESSVRSVLSHTGMCGSICFSSTIQPSIGRGAVGRVADQAFGLEVEAFLDPIDHRLGRVDLFGPVRRRSLDVDDDASVDIDQVVGRVGVERRAAGRCGPARCRVGQREVLRRHARLGRPAPSACRYSCTARVPSAGLLQSIGSLRPAHRAGGWRRP